MKIDFQKIQIHNFKSFSDETFDFHSAKGLVQVVGKNLDLVDANNGAGKTSLFSAILYCLFGEIDQKIKNKNLKNRYTKDKDLSVGLIVKINNKKYKIIRGLAKGTSTYLNVYEQNGSEEIDITKASLADTQTFIEKEILHCDISIFLRTIFLTSDQNYNFFRLSASMKKDFIEKLFNISIFGEMFNLIHKDVLSFNKNISALQNQLIVLTKNNDDYSARIEAFDKDKESKIKAAEAELANFEKELKNLEKSHVEVNEDQVSKLEANIQKLETINSTLIKEANDLNTKTLNQQNSVKLLKSKIDTIDKSVEKYSGLLKLLCDDCKEKVMAYYKLDAYLAEKKKYQTSIESEKTKIVTINESKQKNEEKRKKVDEKLEDQKNKLEALLEDSRKLQNQISVLKSRIETHQNKIEQLNNAENPYKSLFEQNSSKIEKTTADLQELDSKCGYLKFAENVVSQETLKKFIIKDLVNLLNNRIKVYLTKLGTTYDCIFDENMDYHFIPKDSDECEYGNFSAGERMRLTIAASFAFRDFLATRNNITSNILVLDEFIDSNLDSSSVTEILKILQSFTRLYNQKIFVISHRKEIDTAIFDTLLTVKKENNISTIETQINDR